MAIASSEIIEDSPQADGRRFIGFKFVFHTGQEVIRCFLAAADYDKNAGLIEMIPLIEAYMIKEEEQKVLGEVEAGLNPMDITVSHTTIQKSHRKLIRWIMKHPANMAVKLIPLIQWLRVTYTAQQIATYLGLTLATVIKINSRFLELESLQPLLDADNTYIGEI